MLCELPSGRIILFEVLVLILVLMEYALREAAGLTISAEKVVLILVLMEYALREFLLYFFVFAWGVLILVLMEYALRGDRLLYYKHYIVGLNPCFNGICSASLRWFGA